MVSSHPSLTLSIIIPCYNEGRILAASYQRLRAYLEQCDWSCGLPSTWEIIYVNDGSKDGTDVVVAAIVERDPRVRLCTYPNNGGQGKALQSGFAAAHGQWVFCVDADLDYGPEHIERFLRDALEQHADLIVGSPYMAGGSTENVPWVRLWMSRTVNRYFGFVTNVGVSTFTGIVRMYRRESLQRLLLTSRDKDILPEILIKAHTLGMKIVEVPAHLRWQKETQTTRGRGIGVFSTARKALRHLLWGVVENPGFFFSIPLVIALFGLVWFSSAVLILFGQNYRATDAGILRDITNTASHLVHANPQTFLLFLFFFFTTLILSCIGLIVYQNKTKRDHDYLCFTQLADMMRRQAANHANAVDEPRPFHRAG